MKLANALLDRAALSQRIADLEHRLNNNAKVQDGDEPAENPEELISDLDEAINSLSELVTKINLINSTTICNGETLTSLLSRRDALKMRLRILRGFLSAASSKVDRYSNKEIVVKSTVSVSELQKDVDRYAKELRCLDELIQELNWTTEI